MAMVVPAYRGLTHGPRFFPRHYPQLAGVYLVGPQRKQSHHLNGVLILARYSPAQTISTSTIQDRINKLPKLMEDIIQTSISTGPRGAVRLAQGIQAVITVGGEWLADVSKTMNTSTEFPSQLQLGLLSPLYLRRLFEHMGATYIKLGQFIASAPSLFPSEYVVEFQNCFDKAPPVPFEQIEAILREDLGRHLDSIYEYIDPVPIASASIAQVHGARLRGSSEEVVIKVLKPGMEDVLVADLNFVYVVARILEFLSPEISRTSLVGIVQDIKESMLEEVDFHKEAANIDSFREYLETMGLTRQAKAPKVYKHCSARRVLTMERLYGVPLTDLDSIRSLVSSPETSLITALNVWFGSLLACDTFHADVHAGNLWLLNDGRIGFLDFGIVGRISPKTWAAMDTFLTSVVTGEYEEMASALIEMGATDKDVDSKAFASDLEKIFSSIQEVPENRRRASIYKGIVMSRQIAGIHTTIRIHRIIAGVGVEIVFPLFNLVFHLKCYMRSLVDLSYFQVDALLGSKLLVFIVQYIEDLDTELIVTAARGLNTAAVSANLVVDERQMNALFLDVVRVSESYGLKFPREFALLLKQLLYFDRYTRLLAPNLNMLQDQRVAIANRRDINKNSSRRTTRM